MTFTRAVFRFNDDTYLQLARQSVSHRPAQRAQELAAQLDARIVRETGMNLSSVLTSAVANGQDSGFFFGEFDGGGIGRFCLLVDKYARTPSTFFRINAGEKGLLFQYRGPTTGLDTWTAFYSEQDFQSGRVSYSDAFDLVEVLDYRMDVDLREAPHWLRITAELDFVALQDGTRLVPFSLSEDFNDADNMRLKRGVYLLSASLPDGTPVQFIQEPWEGGFTALLPHPLAKNDKVTLHLQLEGEKTLYSWEGDFHYLLSNTSWYPRHSYLRRSRFKLIFRHKERTKVVSVGDRVREESVKGEHNITEWISAEPITFASFAVGPFERHTEALTVGARSIPVEFYSAPGGYAVIKEDFILAEMENTLNFFSVLFGEYPYTRLGAVFFPAGFGQGLPTLLFLPSSGRAALREFAFISHETSHQWWGDMVAWRSYRDQWLSEGFADYSGALYAARRKKPKEAMEIVSGMREHIQFPPGTENGIAAGKLYEIGPLVMGHRLSSNRSRGAYNVLVYEKGALVLRMLHFLFTDPGTGNDEAFYKMMRHFVDTHRNGWASTESFMAIASEHFAQTPLAKKYGLTDLNWFLRQWVYETGLPRYRLRYKLQQEADGHTVLTGTLFQAGVPDNWFMPLPLVLEQDDQRAFRGTIHALGPRTAVRVVLPAKPRRVRLDPDRWVLSEKTSEDEGD